MRRAASSCADRLVKMKVCERSCQKESFVGRVQRSLSTQHRCGDIETQRGVVLAGNRHFTESDDLRMLDGIPCLIEA